MRKILTSVLSVAGLLAVVLALASSPASAAKQVVTVQAGIAGATGEAGTYTVSWETQGGCDPGSGTSGASGSVTLTIDDATPNDDSANLGPSAQTGIVTDEVCNYTYEATFTNAAGADCTVTGSGAAGAIAVADTGVLALTGTTNCSTLVDIVVTIKGAPQKAAEFCTATDISTAGTDDVPCGTDDGARTPVADETVKTAAEASALNDGAVAATTFTVTATPVGVTTGAEPHADCAGASGETAVADTGQPNKVTLKVTDKTSGQTDNCRYDISVALPNGFAAGAKGSTISKGVDPEADGAADTAADGDADTEATGDDGDTDDDLDLTVKVAAVKVYLVQNVIGDAGGASAEYKYEAAQCGAPGLPGALTATPTSGGISTVAGKTLVELRTGIFNISEAIGADPAADGVRAHALNADGDACEATVSVSGVPASCSISHNSPASLATDGDSVRIDVTIDCSAPAASEPPAEEPMDDMGGDDMGGDDMGGDDMGGDDMGDDDMGDDDMGDMGPPQDTPTG